MTKGGFPLSRNFSVRTYANKIKAIYEMPRVNVLKLNFAQLLRLRVALPLIPYTFVGFTLEYNVSVFGTYFECEGVKCT